MSLNIRSVFTVCTVYVPSWNIFTTVYLQYVYGMLTIQYLHVLCIIIQTVIAPALWQELLYSTVHSLKYWNCNDIRVFTHPHHWILYFVCSDSPPRSNFLLIYSYIFAQCTVCTVWSAAPQTTLCKGLRPRFEPRMKIYMYINDM